MFGDCVYLLLGSELWCRDVSKYSLKNGGAKIPFRYTEKLTHMPKGRIYVLNGRSIVLMGLICCAGHNDLKIVKLKSSVIIIHALFW